MPVELVTSLYLSDADNTHSNIRERLCLWFVAEIASPFTPGHDLVLNVILSWRDHRIKSGMMIDVHGELLYINELGGDFDLEVYDDGVTLRNDNRFPLRPTLTVNGVVREKVHHTTYGRSVLVDSMGTTDAPDVIVPLESMTMAEYSSIGVGDPIHVSGLYGASIPTRIDRSDGINIPTYVLLLHPELVDLPAEGAPPHIPGRSSSIFKAIEFEDAESQVSGGNNTSDPVHVGEGDYEDDEFEGAEASLIGTEWAGNDEIRVEGTNTASEDPEQEEFRAWSDGGGVVETHASFREVADGIEDIDDIIDRLGEPELSFLEIGKYSSPVRGAVKRRRHEDSDGASSSDAHISHKRR